MRIKTLLFALLLPALALAQVRVSAPGRMISLGEAVRLSAPDYDADALAYFARAGVTDPAAKRQVSEFVEGVKALGIWPDFVCWPMRSAQNAGTGTAVYSLGGLGIYDGLMVNGPTWGSDGIVFASASSQRIDLNGSESGLHPGANPFWVGAVAKGASGLFSASTVFARGQNNNFSKMSWALRHTNAERGEIQVSNGATQVIPNTADGSAAYGTANWLEGSYDKVSAKISVNGGTVASEAYTGTVQNSTDPATIGSAYGVSYYNGVISFAFYR